MDAAQIKITLDLLRKELLAKIENQFNGLATDNKVELDYDDGIKLFSHYEVPRTLRGLLKEDGKLIAVVECFEVDDESELTSLSTDDLLSIYEKLEEIASTPEQ
jgi:hypothetical protein